MVLADLGHVEHAGRRSGPRLLVSPGRSARHAHGPQPRQDGGAAPRDHRRGRAGAALAEWGDEPHAETIAAAIVRERQRGPLATTDDLVRVIQAATGQQQWRLHPAPDQWKLHPAARTFQALRILVNRELQNLQHLLRLLPACLKPGGRAAIISFHSGEDRLVKNALRDGWREGIYAQISPDPLRATPEERLSNPRSRSAKLRWARLAVGAA